MFKTLTKKLEEAQMRIQPSKCKLLCPTSAKKNQLPDYQPAVPAQLREDIPSEIPFVMDGMKVLGAPFGTP
jgi:hypothetical protein